MSELPRGWIETTLGGIGEWSSGGTPSRARSDYYDGDIPWVKTGDLEDCMLLDTPEKITQAGLNNSSAKLFPPGTLLVAMYGATIGKTALLGVPAATNQACAAFLPSGYSADLIPFLWKFVFAKKVEFIAAGQGGAQPNISQALIKQFPISIPPLAEQKRIVAKLDALSAKSARARTELARIETLVSRYKHAVLSKAFSGELTREWRQRPATSIMDKTVVSQSKSSFGSGRVAKVGAPIQEQRDLVWNCPLNWRWDQVGNCAFVTKLAGFEYTKHVVYDPSGDLRVIKAENAGPEGFRRTAFSRIDSKSVSMLGRSKLVGGELLVVFVGAGTGNVAVVPGDEEFFLGPNIAMARSYPDQVSSAYLEHFFRSNGGRSLLLAATKAVAQPSLSMGAIRATPVALPPLEEQHEIVRRIESAFAKIDRLAKEAKRALELVGRLDEAILAKAFRGELVRQDEGDEPAELLLARIRAEREAAPKAKRGRGANG